MAKVESKSGIVTITSVAKAFPVTGVWTASTKEEKKGAAVYVGSSGDLVVRLVGDPNIDVTFSNVPAGTFLPINAIVINASLSTAGLILGLL